MIAPMGQIQRTGGQSIVAKENVGYGCENTVGSVGAVRAHSLAAVRRRKTHQGSDWVGSRKYVEAGHLLDDPLRAVLVATEYVREYKLVSGRCLSVIVYPPIPLKKNFKAFIQCKNCTKCWKTNN